MSAKLTIKKPIANRNKTAASDPDFLVQHTDKYFVVRLAGECGGDHPMKSRHPGPGSIQMRTNDYLDISNDQRIIDAVTTSLQEEGHGELVSRVWVHNHPSSLSAFEQRMARLMGAEDGVLCPSGYNANVGLVQSIVDAERPVYIDMLGHFSLQEGITSAGATPRRFLHNDMNNLRSVIQRYGPGYILVDALYSTSGSLCPLAELVEVAEEFNCVLVVDETHSFGCHGPNGAGLVSALGLEDRVHFRTVGLSKAVASRGGIIVCSARNAEFIRFNSYPAIFSTSVLPHEVAGYNAVLDIFAADQWRRDRLHENHTHLRNGLLALGYPVEESQSQIISLESGEIDKTLALRDALEENDIFGSIFFPPACAASRCSMRLTVTAGHTRAQLDHILEAAEGFREQVAMEDWKSTRRQRAQAKRRKQPSEPISDRAGVGIGQRDREDRTLAL